MLDPQTNFIPSLSGPYIDLNESVAERKIFYRLGDSEVFQFANKNTTINGEKLINVIPRVMMNDQGFLHVDFTQLDKTIVYELFDSNHYKLTCKKAMRHLIETGKVSMVYSDTYKLPTSIPYIIQTNKNDTKVYVNISDFVVINQYGIFEVTQNRNYNALMAVLFAACVVYQIVSGMNTLPNDLADGLVIMYANMMEKCIHGIVHLDPHTREKVKYLCTEFALVQMYGTEKGLSLFYRYKDSYFQKLTKLVTDSIDNRFNIDAFDKLSTFIDELKRIYPSMPDILSEVNIYTKWINMYGASTAMSVDYLGYHIYTVCMIFFESPLIVRISLEPILEKSKGTEMYRRMQAVIG